MQPFLLVVVISCKIKLAMAKERKVRKIEPYTRKWEKLANELARTYQQIKPCRDCGHPVLDGYCCQTCGSSNP